MLHIIYLKTYGKGCYHQCKWKLEHNSQQKNVIGFTPLKGKELLSIKRVKTISAYCNFQTYIAKVLWEG